MLTPYPRRDHPVAGRGERHPAGAGCRRGASAGTRRGRSPGRGTGDRGRCGRSPFDRPASAASISRGLCACCASTRTLRSRTYSLETGIRGCPGRGLRGLLLWPGVPGLAARRPRLPVEVFFVARFIFGWERARYQKALLEQIPDVMALICRAVAAGIPLSEAIRSVAGTTVPRARSSSGVVTRWRSGSRSKPRCGSSMSVSGCRSMPSLPSPSVFRRRLAAAWSRLCRTCRTSCASASRSPSAARRWRQKPVCRR